jgi:MFS family permease
MSDDTKVVPPELEGFNWAAFLWGGIWAIAHRVWIGLWAFVPVLGLIMNVLLGLKGHEWAWRAGAVPDVDRFNKSQRNWVIVWLAVLVCSIPVWVGVGSALAIFGVRKYLVEAKSAEARNTLQTLATGMARCAERGDLPDTSNWVPADLSSVSGMKYQSTSGEWASEPGFACSGFTFSGPQYFRYRWHQATNASGQFEAEADLDGDGVVDNAMQLGLHCVSGSCVIEPLIAGMPGSR